MFQVAGISNELQMLHPCQLFHLVGEVVVIDVNNVAIQDDVDTPDAAECWVQCISHHSEVIGCLLVWRFTWSTRASDRAVGPVSGKKVRLWSWMPGPRLS